MATNTTYRVQFVNDDHASFEECNGEARPLTEAEYQQNYYNDQQGQRVSYADYLKYYGNPGRHRYIGVIVQKGCTCCGLFNDATSASLWNIDLMDDNPEWLFIRRKLDKWFTVDQVEAGVLPGYLAEVAKETLAEAGYVSK